MCLLVPIAGAGGERRVSVSSVTRGRDLCAVALGWTRPIARVDPHGGATLPPPREGGALGDLTAVRRCWGNPGRGAAIWGRGARPNGSASRSRFLPFHSHGTEPLRSELGSRTGSSSSADRTRVWARGRSSHRHRGSLVRAHSRGDLDSDTSASQRRREDVFLPRKLLQKSATEPSKMRQARRRWSSTMAL